METTNRRWHGFKGVSKHLVNNEIESAKCFTKSMYLRTTKQENNTTIKTMRRCVSIHTMNLCSFTFSLTLSWCMHVAESDCACCECRRFLSPPFIRRSLLQCATVCWKIETLINGCVFYYVCITTSGAHSRTHSTKRTLFAVTNTLTSGLPLRKIEPKGKCEFSPCVTNSV